MNFVLKIPRDGGGYFIISILRDGDEFIIRSKRIDSHGNILVWNDVKGDGYSIAHFQTLEEAKKRAQTIAAMKTKKKGMIEILDKDFPDIVKAKLAAPIDSQINQDELMEIVKQFRKERYVIFKDVAGLEEFYDLGVEYVGYITEDPDIIDVFDKFGSVRGVLVSRLQACDDTEQCKEAWAVGVGMKI